MEKSRSGGPPPSRPPASTGVTGRRPHLAADVLLDLKSAFRDLVRAPGFAAVAILTLATAIGANATLYTLIESVVLRPLPYAQPDRLAAVRLHIQGSALPGLSYPELESLEARTDLFAGVGAIRPNYAEILPIELDVTGVERPEKLQGIEVTPGLLPTLGIAAALGRTIAAEDRTALGTRGLMVSHEYWTRALGADPDVIGSSIQVEHVPRPVVGVLPPGVRLLLDPREGVPETADLWGHTWMPGPGDDPHGHFLRTVVRLADGVELARARAALEAMASAWQDAWPDAYEGGPLRAEITSLRSQVSASVSPILTALSVAVVLVLLVACANVGSLILARTRARQRDLAVRCALGASQGHIARLLLVESLLLAVLGAMLGLAAAALSMGAIRALVAEALPRVADIELRGGTVVVTVLLALFAAAMAGGLAVAQTRGGDLAGRLRGGLRLAGSRVDGRGRGLLTVVQTGVAVVLLVGAGLMVRTIVNLMRVDLGFEPASVVTFKVEMNQTEIPLGPLRYEFFRDVAAAVSRQPEIEEASAIFVLPTRGGFGLDRYGRTMAELESGDFVASFNEVLPGYFETLRIPLLQGADFAPEWPDGTGGEVIVDERIAERLWPGEEAVGRTLWVDFDRQNPVVSDRVEARVVGVAGHVRQDGLRQAGTPQIYVPHWNRPFWGMSFVARLRGDTEGSAAVAAATRAVDRVVDADPDAIFAHSVRELTEVIEEETHSGRLLMEVLSLFSLLALLLSSTGLYGVISYGARQRTREIGIRRAAGAGGLDIAWLIIGGALRLSATGVALGVLGAVALSRLLSSALFGVAPADPLTYVTASGVLFAVGVLAALSPALRAAAVDPVAALRGD